ncbi:DUF2461 domain-containing protein [Cognatishimia maritima]|uniref:TIGR02453 family protein n=1 Tax=Cognatishimia maritima TaxID=870908 RepID=A0A1M5U472_9RHOB|nr:DUF2461 domain-containing protein [Cognatishimia maritima]SHH57656.1 TIGR02453 family protein [Cognatishimia maritima]
MPDAFQSLIPDTRQFLNELAVNNNREWFLENKGRYDSTLKRPAELLMTQVSADLAKMYECEVQSKLFRPHRDVRFSKDKTPYHEHLHMLWTADLGGVQPLGFFFGISQTYISIGAGLMAFDKDTLISWRAMVDGPLGGDLAHLIQALQTKSFRVAEPELKRVPAPYDREHPRADLLRRKSLSAWRDYDEGDITAPTNALTKTFDDLSPLVQALAGMR